MEELIKIIADNGISVGCVIFLMYYILVVERDSQKVQNEICKTLIAICSILGIKQEEIETEKRKYEN